MNPNDPVADAAVNAMKEPCCNDTGCVTDMSVRVWLAGMMMPEAMRQVNEMISQSPQLRAAVETPEGLQVALGRVADMAVDAADALIERLKR